MDICTFWLGNKLRTVDRLCLSSMIYAGHRVRLYSYSPVENLPYGVEQCDASEILPFSYIYKLDPYYPGYKSAVTIVQFSDIFRVMLMKAQKGVWFDTDVYLVRPFEVDKKQVWLARESVERVGVSILYFPPDNPIIKDFEDYLLQKDNIPNWLGFKRRVLKRLLVRLKRQPLTPNRIGITVFGNDGISRLAKKHGFFETAHPKESFYYWMGRKAGRIFDPAYGYMPLDHPDFIGFHIHYKGPTEQKPLTGSFYEWMVKRLPDFHDYDS